jgi:hypothetical protein
MMSHRSLATSGGSSAKPESFKYLRTCFCKTRVFMGFHGAGTDFFQTGPTHIGMLPSGHTLIQLVDKGMNPFKPGLPECG